MKVVKQAENNTYNLENLFRTQRAEFMAQKEEIKTDVATKHMETARKFKNLEFMIEKRDNEFKQFEQQL